MTFSDDVKLTSRLPRWSRSQQSILVRELVLELNPDRVSGQIPCLPAHMIHLGLRYCRHVTGNPGQALGFMDEVISAVQQVVQVCRDRNTVSHTLHYSHIY